MIKKNETEKQKEGNMMGEYMNESRREAGFQEDPIPQNIRDEIKASYHIDIDNASPAVQEYLVSRARVQFHDKRIKKKDLLVSLGLVQERHVEVEPGSRYDFHVVDDNGNVHYYQKQYIVPTISDEEYEALLLAAPQKEQPKEKPVHDVKENKTSGAGSIILCVFTVLIIVIGFIISLAGASAGAYGFITFLTLFIPFLFEGILLFCISDLFDRLAKMQNHLSALRNDVKDISDKMYSD